MAIRSSAHFHSAFFGFINRLVKQKRIFERKCPSLEI